MELRNLWNDDDAVSPVIGVILMVAITVILAAVIATFVLGLGEQVSSTGPQAQFTFDYNEDPGSGTSPDLGSYDDSESDEAILTITHAGGDTIRAGQLSVSGYDGNENGDWNDAEGDKYGANSEISAGDSLTVGIKSDDTISVTWTSENGQSSSTLRQWSGPDA